MTEKDLWEQFLKLSTEFAEMTQKFNTDWFKQKTDEARVGLFIQFVFKCDKLQEKYPTLLKKRNCSI